MLGLGAGVDGVESSVKPPLGSMLSTLGSSSKPPKSMFIPPPKHPSFTEHRSSIPADAPCLYIVQEH